MLRPSTSANSLRRWTQGRRVDGLGGLYDWTAPRFGGLSVAPNRSRTNARRRRAVPEFRPDDGSCRRRPGRGDGGGRRRVVARRSASDGTAGRGAGARGAVGAVARRAARRRFADAVARGSTARRATLDAEVARTGSSGPSRPIGPARSARRAEVAGAGARRRRRRRRPRGSLNDVRQGLAGALAKLSTLEAGSCVEIKQCVGCIRQFFTKSYRR